MNIGDILGGPLVSGLLINYAPRVLKGIMKEFLGSIDFNELIQWVKEDKKLFDQMLPEHQKIFMDVVPRLGPLEWLTTEWLTDAARETRPSLVSLFEGWPEGKAWLGRQITNIKAHSDSD